MSEQDNGEGAIIPEVIAEGIDDPIVLRDALARANKKLEQFPNVVARAKKAEDEVKVLKAQTPEIKPEPKLQAEYSLNDEVVDLRLDGYSKADVEFIMKNGGRKALEDKNSYTSIAINARKEQAKAEAEANKIQDTSGMSEVERKYTPEMMKNMSAAELKKILPHA